MNSNHDLQAAQRRAAFNRRAFLRGLGACIALPAFASFAPWKLLGAESSALNNLATTPTGAPLRTCFVFFPNGAIQPTFWPNGEGQAFEFNETLRPLQGLKQHVRVLGGLDHLCAVGGADGAGDHARGNAVFLTGVRINKSATDVHAGISIDQLLANRVGHLTRFPSLELTCDDVRRAAACDSNYSCAYQYNLSWSSQTTPVTAEFNPRLAFERLFGAGPHGQRTANSLRRQEARQSVLDFVMDDARRMQRRLDTPDRAKLDQYLTGVRDIEARIQQSERLGAAPDPDVETPSGVPAGQEEYLQLMYDLIALAFQTDSTRIATFCLAHDGDNRSFPQIGVSEGHHDISHHQNNADRMAKVAKIDRWYVEQFARFLQKLEDTRDADGNSILHNSMIVYGGGNSDGNRHTHTNLPLVLAGGGGGTLGPSGYYKFGGLPCSNLFLSLGDRMGAGNLDRFGDSTGRLANI